MFTGLMIRSLVAITALAAGLVSLPAAAQSASNGQMLYDSLCRVCHGFPPAGGPERANGDPAFIQAAINTRVPAMNFLRTVLSSSDIADIAAYLRSLSTGGQPAVPANDYTDLWWNPAESGWGLNLIQHASHVIFGVMYTYDENGKAAWYVIPGGTWSTSTVYAGAIYRVTGPPMANTFDSTRVRVNQVGLATLTFASRDSGTFSFNIDGRQVTKTITRQPF